MSAKLLKKLGNFFMLLLLIFVLNSLTAQTAHDLRRSGDKSYLQGSYSEAEENYRKSLEKDPKMKAFFNLGNSLHQQQRYEEAREQYDKAIARSEDPHVMSKAYYNKGNSYFNEQKLEESISSYKQALRYNPDDEDALQNLMLTKQLLKQMQKQEQEQQNQDKEENEDQSEKQEQQDDQQDQEKEENEDEDQKQEQQNEPRVDSTGVDSLRQQQITKEELMKLLKSIEEDDKKIQQKLRKATKSGKKKEKDW